MSITKYLEDKIVHLFEQSYDLSNSTLNVGSDQKSKAETPDLKGLKVKIVAKTNDMFFAAILKDNVQIKKYDDYPIKPFGGGSYVEMTIDMETGQIVGWDKEAAKKFIAKAQDSSK